VDTNLGATYAPRPAASGIPPMISVDEQDLCLPSLLSSQRAMTTLAFKKIQNHRLVGNAEQQFGGDSRTFRRINKPTRVFAIQTLKAKFSSR